MNKNEFGRRLKKIRLEQNFTTNMLAAACDKNPVFIRQIECGSKAPSISTLIELCNALQVSPLYLLGDEINIKSDNSLEELVLRMNSLSPQQLDFIIHTVTAMLDNIDN